MATDTAGGPTN